MPERKEALVHESRIAVPYTWSAGLNGTKFLRSLRDQRKFLGSRCPDCRKVFVPPVLFCGECFSACETDVPVGPRGTLLSFTQARYDSAAHPAPRPVYGLIRLDGADTAIMHLLGVSDLAGLRTGMAVEPVFADDGGVRSLSLRHFRPAAS